MDKLKGFRTVVFNVVMTFVMMWRVWQPEADLPDADQVNQALSAADVALTALWGVGNLVLRAVTNSPIFNKQE